MERGIRVVVVVVVVVAEVGCWAETVVGMEMGCGLSYRGQAERGHASLISVEVAAAVGERTMARCNYLFACWSGESRKAVVEG